MTCKPPLSPEEKTLFTAAMREVKPLKSQKLKAPLIRKPHNIKPRIHSIQPAILLKENLSDQHVETVSTDCVLSFHRPGITQQQLKALRTGKLAYQAKIDLHGLNSDEAKFQLSQFLAQQNHMDHRCVLVIHGKGGRYGETPVLKNFINHWLRRLSVVVAFHSAPSKQGGTGAIYVLLKSMRS